MYIKNCKSVCLILAIFVFLSGICFGNDITESMFFCVPIEETNEGVDFTNTLFSNGNQSTDVVPDNRVSIRTQQVNNQIMASKKSYKLSFVFLCADVFSMTSGKFFATSEMMQLSKLHQEEVIVHYIQNSDGKKRI